MVFSNVPVSGQTEYKRNFHPSLPGAISGMGNYIANPFVNDVGVADLYSLAMPAPDASALYQVTVNGITVGYTTDASPTSAELAAGLYAAMRLDPVFYANVEPTLAGNFITLLARTLGTVLNISTNSGATTNDITINQVNATLLGSVVPFGRFVGRLATYRLDQKSGVGQAALFNSLAMEVLGVTMVSQAAEKTGIGANAIAGYSFQDTMNVLRDTGSIQGIWVESIEPDIVIGDTPYIAISPGNEGKLTRVSAGNFNISSRCKIVRASQPTIGNSNMVLIQLKY